MHFELLPLWLVLGAIVGVVLLVAWAARRRTLQRQRRLRRAARRRKNIAYNSAWEWLKRQRQPRAPRLTDRRPDQDKRRG